MNDSNGNQKKETPFSREEALEALVRIGKRIMTDAKAGNAYANRVLNEEVFDRR